MEDNIENSIREKQVESYGRLMAGFAHDMKNHLGIIRESNGLMSDLVEMQGFAADERSVERLKKAIASIERRVVIAAKILHHLSSFAHRSDTPLSSFQVNDILTEESAFLERFARLQQVNLTLELNDGIPSTYSNPSLLHYIVYQLYTLSLEQLTAGDSLTLKTTGEDRKAVITFHLTGNHQIDTVPLEPALQAALTKAGGYIRVDDTNSEFTNIDVVI